MRQGGQGRQGDKEENLIWLSKKSTYGILVLVKSTLNTLCLSSEMIS